MLTSILTVLALGCTSTVQACAHHDDGEIAPPHVREELLKKWDQEVPPSTPLHTTLYRKLTKTVVILWNQHLCAFKAC